MGFFVWRSWIGFFPNLMNGLVGKSMGMIPKIFLYYNQAALVRDFQLCQSGNLKVQKVIAPLLEMAMEALTSDHWTVVDKPEGLVAGSRDLHDYYHPAPYFCLVRFAKCTIDESKPYKTLIVYSFLGPVCTIQTVTTLIEVARFQCHTTTWQGKSNLRKLQLVISGSSFWVLKLARIQTWTLLRSNIAIMGTRDLVLV